jgi:hypothetical protein
MKFLKKISLVYTLQVFAVILLFSYAGSSSGTETKTPETDMALPLTVFKDSLLTGSTNVLQITHAGKTK